LPGWAGLFDVLAQGGQGDDYRAGSDDVLEYREQCHGRFLFGAFDVALQQQMGSIVLALEI
jgi:hypothetical protein